MSQFKNVVKAIPPEYVSIYEEFQNDKKKKKVNLTMSTYHDSNLKPWVPSVVQKAEQQLSEEGDKVYECLHGIGNSEFTDLTIKLLLGESSEAILEERVYGMQSVSTVGGLFLGASFLKREIGLYKVYYPEQTWEDHLAVFVQCGYVVRKPYRCWHKHSCMFDIEGLLSDLNEADEGTVVLLHASQNNPTSSEPTREQWEQIADVIEHRKLFPFFDAAIQGFSDGDISKDTWTIRYFVARRIEMLIVQSLSLLFGLYNERVGNLIVVMKSTDVKMPIELKLSSLAKAMYSKPPIYGAKIILVIMKDPILYAEWLECLRQMSKRTQNVRRKLYNHFLKLETPGPWNHIIQQNGIFSTLGLNDKQVKILKDKFHVYVMCNGHFNVCGLNDENVEYVAKSITTTILNTICDCI